MWTILKLLSLAAIVAATILPPFAFVASYLFTRPPYDLRAVGRRLIGKLLIPDPSFVFLALGFGSMYSVLSYYLSPWLQANLEGTYLNRLLQIGDLRLDLALPALLLSWLLLLLTKPRRSA
jgi:hypothetical protein